MIIPLLLLLLLQTGLCVSASPLWATTPLVQCESKVLVSVNSTSVSNYAYTIPNPLTKPPYACIGILNWELGNGAPKTLNIFVTFTSLSGTGFTINTALGSSTSVSSLIVGILVSDSSFTLMSAATLQSTIAFTSNVTSGTGPRFVTGPIKFATGDINLTHTNFMLPFLTGFKISSISSSYFATKLTLEIKNSSHYYYNFSVDGDNYLTSGIYTRIIYDQTAVQQTKQTYLDAGFAVANNSLPQTAISFLFSSTTNFMAGINTFNYSVGAILNFNFSTTTFHLISTGSYNHLNLSMWNFRARNCPPPTIYFVEEANLCFDHCPDMFYADETYLFCSACDITCQVCTGPTPSDCTACNETVSMRRLNGTNYCVCKDGYYENGTRNCLPCQPPCVTCTSNVSCLTCNTTGNMLLQGTTCVCLDHSALASTNMSCVLCSTISRGCLNCTPTACTLCDSSLNLILQSPVCVCASGYFLNPLQQCQLCNTTLPHCAKCIDGSTCTFCESPYLLNSGSCSLTIVCSHGFYNNSGVCVEICGDGILFNLECDDGNRVGGDGCSADCKVETNYTCENGTSTSPSLCSYNQPLDLAILTSYKDPSSNTIVFALSVGPILKVLDTFNFSNIVSTSIPNSQISFVYVKGSLVISVSYTETIQNKNVTLELSPPIIFNNTFAMKISSTKFVVTPNNMNAFFYDKEVYVQTNALNVILLVCTGVALIVCLLSARKLIGLEMISMLQVSFLSLSLVKGLQPIFGLWAQYGWISNGYNKLPLSLDSSYAHFLMPTGAQIISYKANYLQNFNWMLVVEVGLFAFGMLAMVLGRLWIDVLTKVGMFVLRELMFTMVFLNTLNVGYSLGLQINTLTLTTLPAEQVAGAFIAIVVSLAFNAAVLVYYFMYTQLFKEELLLLKLNRRSTIHPFVFCLFKLVLGVVMGIFPNSPCLIVALVLQLGFLLYVSFNQPYKHKYLFIRGVMNQTTVTLHLLCLLIYNYILIDEYTASNPSSTALAWVDVIATVISTVFGVYCLILNLCKSKINRSVAPLERNESLDDIKAKDLIHHQDMREMTEGKEDYLETHESQKNIKDDEDIE